MTDTTHFPPLGQHVRLGKHAPRPDARLLKLANYMTEALPAPPTGKAWGGKVPTYPMYSNDIYGDCTCAAVGHQEQVWTSNENALWTPTTTEVTDLYWATGTEDTGRYEQDVLNYWRNTGFGDTKHKIAAYASVNPQNKLEVKQALWLFGGLYIGLALPLSAQTQRQWKVASGSDSQPGSWGGHAVNVTSYSSTALTCITWGMKMSMTWGFWSKYCDEAYAILSTDWVDGTAGLPAANGFNWTQLETDLAQLR